MPGVRGRTRIYLRMGAKYLRFFPPDMQADRPVAALVALALVLSLAFAFAWTAGPVRAPRGGSGEVPGGGPTLQFAAATTATGLNYSAIDARPPFSSAGVYVGDVNRDGRPDLLLLGGAGRYGEFGATRPVHPALYLNTGDDFRLSGALDGIPDRPYLGALFFDHDNDGWTDLLLLARDAEPVFLDNRNGTLRERDAGLGHLSYPMGATAADADGDGCLDLFVHQSGDWGERKPLGRQRATGTNGTVDLARDNGAPNVVYDGDCGSFDRVDGTGLGAGRRWSIAASFADLAGDDAPDLYVTNHMNEDFVYVNRGNWTFRAVELGARSDRNGLSSQLLDANGDGRLDVFVTNVYLDLSLLNETASRSIRYAMGNRTQGNTLFVNRGNATFAERAVAYGVRKGGWAWAASAADFENDGDRDLFHGTEELRAYYRNDSHTAQFVYPAFFERRGDGFERRSGRALGFTPGNARGAARLDYDRDGRLDLVVGRARHGLYPLYHNVGRTGNWLEVRVRGTPDQTPVGATAYVTAGGETRRRVLTLRTDLLSQETRVLHFGLGNASRVERLRVVWPDGTERVFADLDANRRVVVTPAGEVRRAPGGRTRGDA
ncbi:MAG: CRTAC1 family protein [Halobacteriaceae archaeon]